MCGIAGVVSLAGARPVDSDVISAMCSTIVHRGPDAEGVFVEGGVGLGARRLAVIDLAGGDQPLFNEDDRVALVYNGEIYNYRELRRDLRAKGHVFRSGSDGEVLVHLWEEHGLRFLDSVNGMFALALFDRAQRTVLLARDRLGVKPLYVAETGTHVVFGSEPKALLASGLVERRLDFDALREFLTWEYVPAPRTLLQGMQKLEPATLVEVSIDSGRVRALSYWDLPSPGTTWEGPPTDAADAEWEEALAAQIRRSVRRQLVSDVPLGAFLSGGVDSSAVVAEMGDVATFSIGFDDPSYNELEWSRKVAAHLGVPHASEVIRPEVDSLFDQLMPFLDDPIGDFSIFPTYLVSRLARRDVTVALSGDGGDELFGGYDTHLAQLSTSAYERIPRPARRRVIEPLVRRTRPTAKKKGWVNKARRFVEGLGYDERLAHARWRLFLDPARGRNLFSESALDAMTRPPDEHIHKLFEQAGPRGEIDRLLFVDLRSYLPENCLAKVDRMSMACSLEVRVPLLDHELVEFAFRMPPRLKICRRQTKVALKRVAARSVPSECVYRPKEGFSIPIKNWLRTALEPRMRDLLSPQRLSADGIFNPNSVDRLVEEHLNGSENHSHLIWALMVFHDWKSRWIGDH